VRPTVLHRRRRDAAIEELESRRRLLDPYLVEPEPQQQRRRHAIVALLSGDPLHDRTLNLERAAWLPQLVAMIRFVVTRQVLRHRVTTAGLLVRNARAMVPVERVPMSSRMSEHQFDRRSDGDVPHLARLTARFHAMRDPGRRRNPVLDVALGPVQTRLGEPALTQALR